MLNKEIMAKEALEALLQDLREEGAASLIRRIPEGIEVWSWRVSVGLDLGAGTVLVMVYEFEPNTFRVLPLRGYPENSPPILVEWKNAWWDMLALAGVVFTEIWARARERASQ